MVKIEFLEVTIQNCALIAHPDRKGLICDHALPMARNCFSGYSHFENLRKTYKIPKRTERWSWTSVTSNHIKNHCNKRVCGSFTIMSTNSLFLLSFFTRPCRIMMLKLLWIFVHKANYSPDDCPIHTNISFAVCDSHNS